MKKYTTFQRMIYFISLFLIFLLISTENFSQSNDINFSITLSAHDPRMYGEYIEGWRNWAEGASQSLCIETENEVELGGDPSILVEGLFSSGQIKGIWDQVGPGGSFQIDAIASYDTKENDNKIVVEEWGVTIESTRKPNNTFLISYGRGGASEPIIWLEGNIKNNVGKYPIRYLFRDYPETTVREAKNKIPSKFLSFYPGEMVCMTISLNMEENENFNYKYNAKKSSEFNILNAYTLKVYALVIKKGIKYLVQSRNNYRFIVSDHFPNDGYVDFNYDLIENLRKEALSDNYLKSLSKNRSRWYVQLGSFKEEEYAYSSINQFKMIPFLDKILFENNHAQIIVMGINSDDKKETYSSYKVLLGPFYDNNIASNVCQHLKNNDTNCFIVKEDYWEVKAD